MRKRKRKGLWQNVKNFASDVHHHRLFQHSHHLAYCVYYGIALAEDRGIKLIVVGVVFVAAILTAVTGEGEV
jgi:hypothetical protein